MSTLRPLLPTPPALVTNGSFQLGTYKQPFAWVNPLDAQLAWLPSPRLKHLRLKEWQHFALVNDDFYLSLALFDAKLLSLAQVCVYDRRAGHTIFHERKILPGRFPRLPHTLWNDTAHFSSPSFSLSFRNHLNQGTHTISFDIAAKAKLPAVKGSFTCFEPLDDIEPIVVCLPFQQGRAMYSHKCVIPAQGTLQLGERTIDFPKDRSYGLVDIHKGYYPFVMKWHWATAGGHLSDGTLIGFNLTDNQVEQQDRYNENCLWIDGKLRLLPPVRFSQISAQVDTPWLIQDELGMLKLRFQPEVFRFVNLNALILESRYQAPFGTFHGWIKDAQGHPLPIEGLFGMCENFYLRI